jgi:hypothetical protein
MTYDRRPDYRARGPRQGGRPGGGRSSGPRPDRPPRDREGYAGYDQRRQPRSYDRPPQDRGGYPSRSRDDGGMSIRLDPRRLAALKLLAAEAGMRPGELVTQWVEERLDAARRGDAAPAPAGDGKTIAAINARIDELVKRLDALAPAPASAAATEASPPASAEKAAAPKRRGRPPKAASESAAPARKPRSKAKPAAPRVPLHEEIAAIISEQGPMSAGQLATAVTERGRYTAPRTTKPLDAATISARVSNPVYRSRFVRREGKISLAGAE